MIHFRRLTKIIFQNDKIIVWNIYIYRYQCQTCKHCTFTQYLFQITVKLRNSDCFYVTVHHHIMVTTLIPVKRDAKLLKTSIGITLIDSVYKNMNFCCSCQVQINCMMSNEYVNVHICCDFWIFISLNL